MNWFWGYHVKTVKKYNLLWIVCWSLNCKIKHGCCTVKQTFVGVVVSLAYLALAGGTGWVGHMPCVSAEADGTSGVLTRLSDVIRQVVGQTGVCDAARATLALRHCRVLAHQHGANQRPAVHLPFLSEVKTERWHKYHCESCLSACKSVDMATDVTAQLTRWFLTTSLIREELIIWALTHKPGLPTQQVGK